MQRIEMTPAEASAWLSASINRQVFTSMRAIKHRKGPTWSQLIARCGQLSLVQSAILERRHSR